MSPDNVIRRRAAAAGGVHRVPKRRRDRVVCRGRFDGKNANKTGRFATIYFFIYDGDDKNNKNNNNELHGPELRWRVVCARAHANRPLNKYGRLETGRYTVC